MIRQYESVFNSTKGYKRFFISKSFVTVSFLFDHSKARNTSCSVLASVVGPFLMSSSSCWACFGSNRAKSRKSLKMTPPFSLYKKGSKSPFPKPKEALFRVFWKVLLENIDFWLFLRFFDFPLWPLFWHVLPKQAHQLEDDIRNGPTTLANTEQEVLRAFEWS